MKIQDFTYTKSFSPRVLIKFSALVLVLLTSCFANQNRMERYNKIEKSLKQGDTKTSLSYVNNIKKYSKKDRLVYMMDNGALNIYDRNYKESFRFLNDADKYQEDLYTQSVTANISTYLINDNQRPYSGEDYEILYLNAFKAFAFLAEDNNEAAMVEIRKGINKLSVFEIRYQKQLDKLKESTPKEFKHKDSKGKNYESNLGKYDLTDSALLRLISLILHRDDNHSDDALIDKNKINEIWRLYADVYDFRKLDLESIKLKKSQDKVLLDIFAFSGLTAKKSPWNLDVFTGNGIMNISSNTAGRKYSAFYPYHGSIGSFSISIPFMQRRNNRITKAILYVDGQEVKRLGLVERTSNLAVNQFEKQKDFIVMKSLIRATAKAAATYAIQEEARKKRAKGEDSSALEIAGLFSSVFASATEVADIRSWSTLPDNCYFGEIEVEEGVHNVEIKYLDVNNNAAANYKIDFEAKKSNTNNIILSYAL